jgi:hypothetical protein
MEPSTELEYGDCDTRDLDLICALVVEELSGCGRRGDEETISEETLLGFVRELDENEPFEWRAEDALGEDYAEHWDFEWLDSVEYTDTFSDPPELAPHPIGLPASTVDSLIEVPSTPSWGAPFPIPTRFSQDVLQVSQPSR